MWVDIDLINRKGPQLSPIVWPLLFLCFGLYLLWGAWHGISTGALPWGWMGGWGGWGSVGSDRTKRAENPIQFWIGVIGGLLWGVFAVILSLWIITNRKYL